MFGVYAFSDVTYSSDTVNEFTQLTGIEATTAVGNALISFGSSASISGIESTTEVGDILLIISCSFVPNGLESSAELGQVIVYGLERNADDQQYNELAPAPDSNYQNIRPAPDAQWNDLVT